MSAKVTPRYYKVLLIAVFWLARVVLTSDSDVVSCIPDEIKGVRTEIWLNIRPPGSLSDLKSNSRYPNNPSHIRTLTTFNVPKNFANLYGQRLRAYILMPFTGVYAFQVFCDWMCEASLTNSSHDKIMSVKADKSKSKRSKVYLQKHEPYLLDVLHSNGKWEYYLEIEIKEPGSTSWHNISRDSTVIFVPGISRKSNYSLPGNWAPWSTCSRSCGLGHVKRQRFCASRPPLVNVRTHSKVALAPWNETKVCAHSISCTGNKYLLSKLGESCDQACKNMGLYACASTGHDFPTSSAFSIYAALNVTCLASGYSSTYKKPDEPKFYSAIGSMTGECIGYENIPDVITCWKVAHKRERRLCPCKPLPISLDPPQNISVQNTSSTSIKVTWILLTSADVKGYHVTLNYTLYSMTCNATTSSVEISGLKKFTAYCVRVAAITVISKASPSRCINVTTDEDVPDKPPIHLHVTPKSPWSVGVSWRPVPKGFQNGLVIGYNIIYQALNDSSSVKYSVRVPAANLTTLIPALNQSKVYCFQILAYTRKGDGYVSSCVLATTPKRETCLCPSFFVCGWWPKPPYTTNTTKGRSSPGGLIPSALSYIMQSVCGVCKSYNSTNIIYNLYKTNASSLGQMEQHSQVHFWFPITEWRSFRDFQELEYFPLITVPGFVFITKQMPPGKYARIIARSVFQCWPLVVVNVAMGLLAGMITWFLDSSENQNHFPASFTVGVQEAFWWSFVTMTTIGYGDRVPKSKAAQVFAMIWSLVGIVLTALLTGALTASLIITAITQTLTVEKGTRVAVVNDSLEQRIIKQIVNSQEQVSIYQDTQSLYSALSQDLIDAALVDMHTAWYFKRFFFKSKLKIARYINHEFTYGVLIGGNARRLIPAFMKHVGTGYNTMEHLRKMDKIGDTDKLEEGVPMFTDKPKIDFLDPSSDLFYIVMLLLSSLLALAVVSGVCYKVLAMI